MEIFPKKPVIVRKVFANELQNEFAFIRIAITRFRLVSIDTEFPGTIFKQSKLIVKHGNSEIKYKYMKNNVDALKIIQLGLTLSDFDGNLPDFGSPFCYVWEFNFRDFDVDKDDCDMESIDLLKRQGIDFEKNKAKGIDSMDFAALIWSSGLLSHGCCGCGGFTWITFHGAYDFGFLMKILTQAPLADDFDSFMQRVMQIFGGEIFDIKYTSKFLGMYGGLEKMANLLNVPRQSGSSHQAGSDSLLTLQCFMELKNSGVFKYNPTPRILPALALYGLVSEEELEFM